MFSSGTNLIVIRSPHFRLYDYGSVDLLGRLLSIGLDNGALFVVHWLGKINLVCINPAFSAVPTTNTDKQVNYVHMTPARISTQKYTNKQTKSKIICALPSPDTYYWISDEKREKKQFLTNYAHYLYS